jgi:hypothetical protein
VPLDRSSRWHNQAVSDTEALEWALKAAKAAADEGTPTDRHVLDRLERAGATALQALQACEAQATWFRPAAGDPDPQLLTRHDVRAATQAVLAQLELIGIAWAAWDAATRAETLGELEDSTRQLVDEAERFNRGAI